MIKLKEIIEDDFLLYGIAKRGVGTYEYEVDWNQLKIELDKLGYKGRYSNEDYIKNEDYVFIRINREIRLYSNRIKNDRNVEKILRKFNMIPWPKK